MIYKLKLTGGESITLTQEDFDKVMDNIGQKAFVKVSGAIFNTAYIVSIIPEKESFKKTLNGYIDEDKRMFITKGEKFESLIKDKFDTTSLVKSMKL